MAEKKEKVERFIQKDYANQTLLYRGDKLDLGQLNQEVKDIAWQYGIAVVIQRSEAAAEKGASAEVKKALGLKRWETLLSGKWASQERSAAKAELEALKAEAAAQAEMIERQNGLLVAALTKMPVKIRAQVLAEYSDEERELIEKLAQARGIDLTK